MSRGICCTSTATLASDWRCRTSCGPDRSSCSRWPRPSTGGRCGELLLPASCCGGSGCRCGAVRAIGSGSPGWSANRLTWCRSTSPDIGWTGCRYGPGNSSTSGSSSRPGWTRANPFSLSIAPNGRTLRITAKALGEGSARLAYMRPGTWVLFEGPYGRLSSRARTQRKVLLAGAGVGITPLRALAEGLEYAPGEAIMLQRYTAEPLFARELEMLAAPEACTWWTCPARAISPTSVLGPAARGMPELIALQRWIPDVADREVFLCGPSTWTDGIERLVLAAGASGDRIHTESFGW